MFSVDDNLTITISRGDTATIAVKVEAEDGETVDGTMLMSLKKIISSEKTIWQKSVDISEGTVEYSISADDTNDLVFGTYYWDLRVVFGDGTVYTPISPKKFVVAEVIGDV